MCSDHGTAEVVVRGASVGQREALESLQRRASDVWEQYRAQLAAHPDAIELPLTFIAGGCVRVAAAADGVPLRFSVVVPGEDGGHELDGLFVEPARMRQGIGRLLVEDACARARRAGALRLEVVAGPRGFYERVGFDVVGTADTRFGPALRMRRVL